MSSILPPKPPPPAEDDPLWREAQPLVHESLQDFPFFDDLRFSTSSSTLVVASDYSSSLQKAADRMRPVFEAAGWKYASDFRNNTYKRLAFRHPEPLVRPNLHVVR